MANNLNFFRRQTWNGNTPLTGLQQVLLASRAMPGMPAIPLSGLNATDRAFVDAAYFPFEINLVNPQRLLLGSGLLGGGIYESMNMGDIIADVSPIGMGKVLAVAYGASNNVDAAYFADSNGDIWKSDNRIPARVFVRTNFNLTPETGNPLDIMIDPNDFNKVYAIDSRHVIMSSDAGMNWTNITGNLTSSAGALTSELRSITLTPGIVGDSIVLVGGNFD